MTSWCYRWGERLLIFASQWSLQFLASCNQWHSDGTFKCRPLVFEQIYILYVGKVSSGFEYFLLTFAQELGSGLKLLGQVPNLILYRMVYSE